MQRPAIAVSAALGAALSVGLAWWEQANGLSIRNLGPIAVGFAIILLAGVIYQSMRHVGGNLTAEETPLDEAILALHHAADRATRPFTFFMELPYPKLAEDLAEQIQVIPKEAQPLLGKLVMNIRDLGAGGIHGSSVTGLNRPCGPFRYLLWVAEDMGQGTFITEIDIHAVE